MLNDCDQCQELEELNQIVLSMAEEISRGHQKLNAVIKWQDGLSYAMSPEKWVQKQGDLNDILGLNDQTSEVKTQ